ncbi:hypothetical protein D3C77_584830 [compost metagenome]
MGAGLAYYDPDGIVYESHYSERSAGKVAGRHAEAAAAPHLYDHRGNQYPFLCDAAAALSRGAGANIPAGDYLWRSDPNG